MKVLLVSEQVRPLGERNIFRCAATAVGSIWRVEPENAVETYEETREDGWDVVVIDCEDLVVGMGIAKAVHDKNEEQRILLLHSTIPGLSEAMGAVCAARRIDVVARVFELRAGFEPCACSKTSPKGVCESGFRIRGMKKTP